MIRAHQHALPNYFKLAFIVTVTVVLFLLMLSFCGGYCNVGFVAYGFADDDVVVSVIVMILHLLRSF